MGHTLLETRVQQCSPKFFLVKTSRFMNLSLASASTSSAPRVWRIGDVTPLWSRAENLKCLSPRAPSLGAQR